VGRTSIRVQYQPAFNLEFARPLLEVGPPSNLNLGVNLQEVRRRSWRPRVWDSGHWTVRLATRRPRSPGDKIRGKSTARIRHRKARRSRHLRTCKSLIYIELYAIIDSFLRSETVNMPGRNFWIEHGPGQRLRFQ
jgi:hypothetical protein